MKQCIKCGELKDESLFRKGINQCKECIKQYHKQYAKQYNQDHKEERKQYRQDHKEEIKQYYQDHKEEHKQYGKQYRLDNIEEKKQYCLEHKEQMKQYRLDHIEERKQYLQSKAGKEAIRKSNAKKRNMKHISLMNNPFPEEISVDYHHILNNFHAIDSNNPWNKWFVIPMPEITHNFVSGRSNNLEHWRHNEEWIRKIYDINIKELLS